MAGDGLSRAAPEHVSHQSRQSGRSLKRDHSRAFTVYPARTDEVITRRLEFAYNQSTETGRLETFPEGLTIDSASLEAYIEVLIKAFRHNAELKEFIDNLSGGNLRQALDFLNAFVGSGYVNTARILDISDEGGVYTVPMHEVFRAIAYGDGQHYDPTASPIANVLDITQDDGREHFLLPGRSISTAAQLADSTGSKGYVEADELLSAATGWGFAQEQVGGQLERAFSANLLEGNDEGGDAGLCRVTTIGVYTLRRLLPSFVYLDAVVVDTPIVEVSARAEITLAWSIA